MYLCVPMAGRGNRFVQAGYVDPKPFIPVKGKAMVQRVLDNLDVHAAQTVLITLEDYKERLECLLPDDDSEIVSLSGVTEGAACTIMKAIDSIDPEQALIVANSDQYLDWVPWHFVEFARRERADGLIATFRAESPKWSYAKIDSLGFVTGVYEKEPVSNEATCGVYYYRKAKHLFTAIDKMIRANRRVNGEFYLAPAYNEMILDGAKVLTYPVPKMYGMGTPQDLQETIASGIFGD